MSVRAKRGEVRAWVIALLTGEHEPDADGCVLFPYMANWNGYPRLSVPGGRGIRLNRYVCEAVHGPPPADKPLALHACGRRDCLAPGHLYWGDQADNAADRDRHGTTTRGEQHPFAKMTEARVRVVRRLHTDYGFNGTQLAWLTGVTPEAMNAALRGDTWRHVDP